LEAALSNTVIVFRRDAFEKFGVGNDDIFEIGSSSADIDSRRGIVEDLPLISSLSGGLRLDIG
jgi:hypothetical protein